MRLRPADPGPHAARSDLGWPEGFADADANLEDADYVIFGVSYDRTHSFRPGAAQGPPSVREAAWNFETWYPELELDLAEVAVHDAGNVRVSSDDEPASMVDKVRTFAAPFVKAGKVVICLGGEHNVAFPVLDAVAGSHEDVRVVHVDAHLDFRQEYEGEAFSHACVLRRIAERIGPSRCGSIGVRSVSKDEWQDARDMGLRYVTADHVVAKGIRESLSGLVENLGVGPVYLTVDIDAVDPSQAPGTGTPEPFGMSDRDVREIVRTLAPRLVGMDVLEVAPTWDHGTTALLAARLVREAIAYREHSRRHNVP